MNIKKIGLLISSHLSVGILGVALGIYLLPILIAPPSPEPSKINQLAIDALFTTQFDKNRQDSDMLHWGEGQVHISHEHIVFNGKLSPGPDFRLYLAPEFIETETDFMRLKSEMVQVGHVTTFDNFIVDVPQDIKPESYKAVIVWCEAFNQFITSARYQ